MKTLYVVVAFGGQYDDAWESHLRAHSTREAAENMTEDYERWLTKIRDLELPEALQEHNINYDDDEVYTRQLELLEEAKREWEDQVMKGLGMREEDFEFFRVNWDSSYACDRPYFRIDELEYDE